MTAGLSVILEAGTTQKASVAKMSLLIFITEPRSRGFAPSSACLYWILRHVVPQNDIVVCHPDAKGGRIQ